MYWVAVIYFFVLLYLLGESLSFLLKYQGKDLFEDIIIKIGLGLAVFPIIILAFNIFHIIYWWPILVLSGIIPVYRVARELMGKDADLDENVKLVFKKTYIFYIALIVIFAVSMMMYSKGSFVYPYLEDGDPLSHALSAKYIDTYGTYSVPLDFNPVAHYLEPYPPFYASFMSLFVDLSGQDMVWTLKFFNSLLISLGILFIFFAAKKWTGSNWKAIFASFLLLAINSYMSHFIFASTYATTMLVFAFYGLAALQEGREEKRKKGALEWKNIAIASIIISSVFLIQPTVAAAMALFLGAFLVFHLGKWKAFKSILAATLIAGLIACLFWVPAIIKFGIPGVSETMGFTMFTKSPTGLDVDSSGNKVYSFADLMNAPATNMIDQPIGVGSVLWIAFLLAVIGVLLHSPQLWKGKDGKNEISHGRFLLAALLWTALMFFLLMGNALPFKYKFVPHRQWAYFSLGIVLIVAVGGQYLLRLLKYREVKWAVAALFVIGVIFTGLMPKYNVQTSQWPPGPEWRSPEELSGYLEIENKIPRGSKLFPMCATDMKAASSNMDVVFLDPELKYIKSNYMRYMDANISVNSLLKSKGVQYATVDTECAQNMGLNETNDVLKKIQQEGMTVVFANQGFVLLKVN